MNKSRALVQMSGGVDSTVAAAKLVDEGYEVIGVTFAPYEPREITCCFSETDAKAVCDKLGIRHIYLDLKELFQRKIIDYFLSEYMQGRTPNPCTKCNPEIKFGRILELADELDAYWLATGHYANVRYDEVLQRHIIYRSANKSKDQTYVLWGLKEEQIARIKFPIGNNNKNEIREIAKNLGFLNHNRTESQDVCFIPYNNYKDYLYQAQEDIIDNLNDGYIVFHGKIMGKHKGYPFYTIGQRHGLGISYSEPLFVKRIIPETNTIEVGTEDEIYAKGLLAHSVNLIKYNNLEEPRLFEVKIRYNGKSAMAYCNTTEDGILNVEFLEPKAAITPGQSVVIYDNDDLVGGAIIEKAIN